VLLVVGVGLTPGPMNGSRTFDNPLGLAGPLGVAAEVVGWIGWVLLFGSLPAAALCVLLRFRSSRGVERQQLRWIAAGAATAVVSMVLAISLPVAFEEVFIPVAVLSPVLAVAIAVLRYRLWELDRLVSRTVTYTLVTGLLVLPYLLIVPAVTRLAADAGDLAVAGATLAAAALFQPLRGRVQRLVDRRFNRRRYDATRIVEAFASRLRQQVDLDVLSAELLSVVDQTVQSHRVSLWLRPASPTR
jgi:hypothetical protein